MSDKIIKEVFTKCGITAEKVKDIPEQHKSAFYKMIKVKLQMYKKNKESGIRDYYNELKNKELKQLQMECDKTEAMVLSLLNTSVSKPKKAIPKELQQTVCNQKYGDNKDDICNICGQTSITKDDFSVTHMIPESRGGNNDNKNLIPVCDACYTEYNDSKSYLLHYINDKFPEIDYSKLYTELVAKYNMFHYIDNTIVFVNEQSRMERYMIICETQLHNMNKELNGLMDINIMKPSGVILDEGTLNMFDYTGNMNEKCYFIDIMLLYQYKKLLTKAPPRVKPQLNKFESIYKFNTDLEPKVNCFSTPDSEPEFKPNTGLFAGLNLMK
jgi:hypothetical protein